MAEGKAVGPPLGHGFEPDEGQIRIGRAAQRLLLARDPLEAERHGEDAGGDAALDPQATFSRTVMVSKS